MTAPRPKKRAFRESSIANRKYKCNMKKFRTLSKIQLKFPMKFSIRKIKDKNWKKTYKN